MTDTPTTDLTAPEAVEHLAVWLETYTERTHPAQDAAATLRALSAALEAEKNHKLAIAGDKIDAVSELRQVKARLNEAVEVIKWYGDRAKDARLIHSGGDAARHELQADGGKFARAFLASMGGKP